MTMKQEMGGMTQAMNVAEKASHVDDDAVTIAADDAGATAAAQKIGEALEDDQPDNATRETQESDDRTQQATSPIGTAPKDAASAEKDRELVKQAKENARLTDEMMEDGGFGDHVGTEAD